MYPFIYILAVSLNDGMDAMRGGIYFFPREFTLENYRRAFGNPFILTSFRITFFRTLVGTGLAILVNSMAAYALTKRGLPGRSKITFYFFFTTLFNGGLIPYFIQLRNLGLINNIWLYVFASLFSFYNMIIMRTSFNTIPQSIAESAYIDGAGDVRIFFQIYMRLSGPMLATIALFFGVGHWNDWYQGNFFMTQRSLIPVATLLHQVITEAGFEASFFASGGHMNINMMSVRTTPESIRMAFLMIITIPIVIVYPFLQRFFVKGVMLGSLKE